MNRAAEVKFFELRDSMTFIPAIAVRMRSEDPDERYLLRRAGYGQHPEDPVLVLLTHMEGGMKAEYDPHAWPNEPWRTAQDYIAQHWDELPSGEVIDCEFIRGETSERKISERFGRV